MTEHELADLRTAYNRTTPGTWAVGQPYASWLVFLAEQGKEDEGLTREAFAEGAPIIAQTYGEELANAEFIALAHRMVLRLLDEIERLRADNAALREAIYRIAVEVPA
jgi:hypothetical protein